MKKERDPGLGLRGKLQDTRYARPALPESDVFILWRTPGCAAARAYPGLPSAAPPELRALTEKL